MHGVSMCCQGRVRSRQHGAGRGTHENSLVRNLARSFSLDSVIREESSSTCTWGGGGGGGEEEEERRRAVVRRGWGVVRRC